MSSSSTSQQETGIIALFDSFRELVGPNATLRKLLVEPTGVPLFHEAGVYLESTRTVSLTSNRLRSDKHGQEGALLTLPVDAIPASPSAPISSNVANGNGILPPLSDEEQKALWASIKIRRSDALEPHLSLPNGGTNWDADHILICEQGNDALNLPSRLVKQHVQSGKTEIVLHDYHGQPFSSLNDAVRHPQTGAVWFTDPVYGVEQNFKTDEREYAPDALYVWQPSTGEVTVVDDRYEKPNGVTFLPSPANDGSGLLLTTDTSRFRMRRDGDMGEFYVDEAGRATIYSYPVPATTSASTVPLIDASQRRVFAESTNGVPDGIHTDLRGNVWAGHGDGVHVYEPTGEGGREGKLIGKVILPGGKGVANFCWAGKRGEEEKWALLLFAEDELWLLEVGVNGRD